MGVLGKLYRSSVRLLVRSCISSSITSALTFPPFLFASLYPRCRKVNKLRVRDEIYSDWRRICEY